MPIVIETKYFGGGEAKIQRLGLRSAWSELTSAISDFDLRVEEQVDANGGGELRKMMDARFRGLQDWVPKVSGGIDWTKMFAQGEARIGLGVEVQFSARSDLMIVDVDHLRNGMLLGAIDIGVLVVPSDRLRPFLTDRIGGFTDAIRAVERARASDLPIAVIAIEHDGPGIALPKQKKRKTKKRKARSPKRQSSGGSEGRRRKASQ